MTRDELANVIVREVVSEFVGDLTAPYMLAGGKRIAEAVLDRIAAQGIVMGKIAEYTSDIDMTPIRERDLALVQLIGNE